VRPLAGGRRAPLGSGSRGMLEANAQTLPAAQPYDPLERWSHLSLATQFLLAGGLASVLAMAVIGFLVKSLSIGAQN